VKGTSVDAEVTYGRVTLSPREVEVLELVSLGLTNAAVARRLAVSVAAVKFHLASVYRKLDVGNRTEAVVAYLTLKNDDTAPAGAEKGA
jgi:DNA-binding NarL/FixJ family response regulator